MSSGWLIWRAVSLGLLFGLWLFGAIEPLDLLAVAGGYWVEWVGAAPYLWALVNDREFKRLIQSPDCLDEADSLRFRAQRSIPPGLEQATRWFTTLGPPFLIGLLAPNWMILFVWRFVSRDILYAFHWQETAEGSLQETVVWHLGLALASLVTGLACANVLQSL